MPAFGYTMPTIWSWFLEPLHVSTAMRSNVTRGKVLRNFIHAVRVPVDIWHFTICKWSTYICIFIRIHLLRNLLLLITFTYISVVRSYYFSSIEISKTIINGRKACSIGLKVHTSIVFFQTIVYTNLLEIVTVYIILQHEWSNYLHKVKSDYIQ